MSEHRRLDIGCDPYQNLASAIVKQAVVDYKTTLHRLERNPKNKTALLELLRLNRFFHSGWYEMLTEVDADRLLKGVRLLAKKESTECSTRTLNQESKASESELMEFMQMLDLVEWNLNAKTRYRLKGKIFEVISRTEAVRRASKEAVMLGEAAIRSVGFQVRSDEDVQSDDDGWGDDWDGVRDEDASSEADMGGSSRDE